MDELQFDLGLKTFSLPGGAEVRFNPTDALFLERVYGVMETMDAKKNEWDAAAKAASPAEVFDIFRSRDAEMRALMDEVLGEGVSDTVFRDVGINALADGLPLWANLLLTVLDKMDASLVAEQKRTNPRIQKYTAKYKRKK